MSLWSWLFGKEEKLKKKSTMDPQQLQAYQQQLGQLSSGNLGPAYQSGLSHIQQLLSNDPEAFKKFEEPFQRQFREQTIPELSSLFAGAGAGSSSGFQQALGQAGAGLSENLAALRGNLQQNAANQALQYSTAPHELLQKQLQMPTFQYYQQPGQEGFLPSLLAQGTSAAASSFFGPFAGPIASMGGKVAKKIFG